MAPNEKETKKGESEHNELFHGMCVAMKVLSGRRATLKAFVLNGKITTSYIPRASQDNTISRNGYFADLC